jgi:hypothetical protein
MVGGRPSDPAIFDASDGFCVLMSRGFRFPAAFP